MTFIHQFVQYLLQIWHEFAVSVHLEAKNPRPKGFLHQVNMWLITLPIGGVLLALGLLVLLVAALLTVPLAKMFGFDLGSRFAKTQKKLQGNLRPAMWLPFIGRFHSNRQKWTSIFPAEEIFKDLLNTIKNLEQKSKNSGESFEVVEIDQKKMFIKVNVLSPKMKYLDVLEIKCSADSENLGGTTVDAFSYSTGFAPLALLPYFGVLISLSLFWLPFSDGGNNKKRLDHLRSALKSEIHLAIPSSKGKSE